MKRSPVNARAAENHIPDYIEVPGRFSDERTESASSRFAVGRLWNGILRNALK
jgi:hypothetical protein